MNQITLKDNSIDNVNQIISETAETVKFSVDSNFYSSSIEKATISPELMKYSWPETNNLFLSTRKCTLFYVMRHGETPSNAEKRIIGCEVDEDLTAKGIGDAVQVAKKIASLQKSEKIHIESIYSSPLIRAAHTAQLIAEELNLGVHLKENLKEINWGDASGLTDQQRNSKYGEDEKELMVQCSELSQLWNHLPLIPNAEKYNTLLERTIREMQDISRQHENKEIALVCHGRLIRTLAAKCINSENRDKVPYAGNCDVVVFRYSEKLDGSKPRLDFLGIAE